MRNAGTLWVIALIMLLLDFYVFQAVRTVTQTLSDKTRLIIHIGYWVLSVVTLLALLSFPYIQLLQNSKFYRNYIFAILVGLFFAKLIAALFFLTDDLRRIALWLMSKIFPGTGAQYMSDNGGGIPRSTFLSWMGLGMGGSLFGTLLYGFSNKYNYQIKKLKLSFPNLPEAFHGMKMVHISDIHSGSFQNKKAVEHGIDMILQEKPDLIVFTGDLVNDRASEME